MHDFMEARHDLVGIDAPAFGGGDFQHLARAGADLAHRLDEMAHAARSIGILIAVGLFVAGRLDDTDPRPVGIHFVGDDHGERRARGAVAHLGTVRHDGDGAVLGDGHEDVRIGHHAMRHLLGAGGIGHGGADRRELRGEHEHAGAGHALEQFAPADIGDGDVLLIALIGHVRPPSRRRERPYGCAGSSRNGRCCRTWRRRSACRWEPGFSPATPPPA